MSSYAELTLGTLSLAASRNQVDPDLIWLFRESDKTVEQLDRRNPQKLSNYIMEKYIEEYDENNPFLHVEYRCTAIQARDRLELKGFTREVAELGFKSSLRKEIEWTTRTQFFSNSIRGVFDEKLDLLSSLTVEDWLDALRRISNNGLDLPSTCTLPKDDPQLPLLRYMLRNSDHFYGFPGVEHGFLEDEQCHFGIFARLAVEAVSPDEQLVYDLSSLVHGGWVQEDGEPIIETASQLYADLQLAEKVIVVTEGDTDKEVLERSLRLLYPHLADYFHFFDFSLRRLGGGAGELANLVRAFAAAGVQHRILALFDNDTAAKSALSTLDSDGLPKNIAVRHYPDIALAIDYPTSGPAGNTRMDVNGLAGSLELYLGRDILTGANGELSSVLWTGYDHKLGVYQGELRDKQCVLEEFKKKLARCESDQREINSFDWEGIHAIIDAMRTAFHEVDKQAILETNIDE